MGSQQFLYMMPVHQIILCLNIRFNNHQFHSQHLIYINKTIELDMELGLAIGVFIIVAVILLSLFCVVTRYFNFKLKRALQEQAEIYSLIQGIQGQKEDINQGQYQDFINKRILDKKKRQQQNNKNYQLMLQMTQDINQPLKDAGQNIYGNPKLKNKLNKDIVFGEESGRSLVSAKSFHPDKLTRRVPDSQTPKSTFSKRDLQNFNSPNKRKADITRHKYISKLVCYTEQNLNIVECKAIQLWKQGEIIKQRRKIYKTIITPIQLDFDETLEAYGFQKGLFQAYKYITTYEIVGMKPKQLYPTKTLKQSQQKQPIQFPSFYIYKDKLDEQPNNSSLQNSKY